MQTVTLIDLDDYTVGQVELALNQNRHGDFEEVHVYLAGNPLHLFVTTGEEVRAYRVADVLTGTLGAPVSTLAIRPNSHGPAIAHGIQRLYSATADGLAVLDLVGAHLQGPRLVPWDVDGVTAGQNFRPRLSFDNSAIYGAVIGTSAPALDPSQWAAQQNYIHAVDLRTETARLLPLAPGVVGRFSRSRPYALFWNIHPDGDHAYLLDIDPSSPTFQQMVMSVPLTPLSHGPVAGEPTTGKEARTGTITPDGRWAFVSHGGDGVISVIATAARRVTTMLSLPTPLSGGGYLVAVQLGMPLLDMHAR
jgi:DNA-binding beta-propeller fold protein YncE